MNTLLARHLLARTLLVTTLLGLLVRDVSAAAADATAGVIRAAIQPPATRLATEEVRQPKLVAIHCLATLLHERLLSRPGLLLVDPQRFAAIRDELTSPALVKPGRLTLAAFAARLQVDLLVQMEPADGGIAVEVAATGGSPRLQETARRDGAARGPPARPRAG
jgi:hypothetical protein